MPKVDPAFDGRLKKAYEAAMAKDLWKGKYASVNHHEYFAEGVQSWFDNNRPPDHDHNHVDTRKELWDYDPALAALCEEVFRDAIVDLPPSLPRASRATLRAMIPPRPLPLNGLPGWMRCVTPFEKKLVHVERILMHQTRNKSSILDTFFPAGCWWLATGLLVLGGGRIEAEGIQAKLLEVRKIWDAAPHNAFTDLEYYKGQWFCAFREGFGACSEGRLWQGAHPSFQRG